MQITSESNADAYAYTNILVFVNINEYYNMQIK